MARAISGPPSLPIYGRLVLGGSCAANAAAEPGDDGYPVDELTLTASRVSIAVGIDRQCDRSRRPRSAHVGLGDAGTGGSFSSIVYVAGGPARQPVTDGTASVNLTRLRPGLSSSR